MSQFPCANTESSLNLHRSTSLVSDMKIEIDFVAVLVQLHLVICDGGFKVRIYDTIRFMCHKTFLGPAFGTPIFHMHSIRNHLAKVPHFLIPTHNSCCNYTDVNAIWDFPVLSHQLHEHLAVLTKPDFCHRSTWSL